MMKPFRMAVKTLSWFCVFPFVENTTISQKSCYFLFTFVFYVSVFCSIVSSAEFFRRFVSVDLAECLYSVFQMVAAMSVVFIVIFAMLYRNKIEKFFDHLERIYDENSHPDSFAFLAEANSYSEWIWPVYAKLLFFGYFSGNVLISIVSAIIVYLVYDEFLVDYMYHAFRIIVPWNQHCPVGYLAEVFFNIFIGGGYLCFNGSILLLFISICLHHLAFYKIFHNSLQQLKEPTLRRNYEQIICQLVYFHNSVKEWFVDTATVYSPFILIQLICNVPFLACVIFQLDFQMQHTDFNLIIIFIGLVVSSANFLVYCFLGKLATDSFANMSISLFEANWQVLPIKLQKYFILMIANAQRPLYYHGFNVAIINLETFTKLLKTVITYYMMFKTLTE